MSKILIWATISILNRSLFQKGKGLSPIIANRLQRYAFFLSTFDYQIEFTSGKNNIIADALSRLPMVEGNE